MHHEDSLQKRLPKFKELFFVLNDLNKLQPDFFFGLYKRVPIPIQLYCYIIQKFGF